MPLDNDIIKTTIIQEMAGVQMSNTAYWQIVDLGDDPTTADGLTDIVNAYFAVANPIVTDAWSIVCAIYENLTTIEAKQIVFFALPGTSMTQAHPQDQVLRINEYGQDNPGDVIVRGAWNQSGLQESLSTRGRVNDFTLINPLVNFLTTQQIMAGPSWTLNPQVREQLTPGPPPTFAFRRTIFGQASTRFFKLGSRKTSLCAQL